MAVASIPGFNVHKIGKDRYSVAVNNGNLGAAIVNKSQLKMMADMYGGEVKENSTTKKVLGGLLLAGAAAAAVVYRKNIGEFVKGLKNGKVSELAETAKTKAVGATETVKNTASNAANVVKEKAGKWYNKIADWVIEGWNKVKNFFKGIFGKKVDAVQQELPFPKDNKTGLFEKAGNWFKSAGRKVKNFFSKKEKINNSMFKSSILPETKQIKKDIILNYANADLRPSGTTHKEWRSALASRYGAKNVH